MQLLCLAVLGLAVGGARGSGHGLSEYEYEYDELPREHLAPLTRFGRDTEHVQHVPADAPRAPGAADAGVVQRVPRSPATALQESAAPEAAAAEAQQQPAAPAEQRPPGARRHAAEQPQVPEPATELEPPPRVEGAEEDVSTEQTPQVPTAVPKHGLGKEDMETANFFWGLGPVYPHLYVYRRVPHLVPLHGWNPYHAYLLTHPSR
ncbi:submandibular gland secretory Glx-rich protein CB-like isoform X2 [Frankliniella occidentalis]|nr:submandibular gland secretory Glx-rich protein CB-like isoform X2 [Frankliniella occidentalis]XP_052132211.1 submandibular gland secretory Glx-rich protein CB-like isoform X2 [Frankliniella occidentalis]